MKQEEWTQRLRQQMAGHQEAPQRDLWEGIEASLSQQEAAKAAANQQEAARAAAALRPKARFVSLRRWAAAAAFIGLMAGGAYWWYWRAQTASTIATRPQLAKTSLPAGSQQTAPSGDDRAAANQPLPPAESALLAAHPSAASTSTPQPPAPPAHQAARHPGSSGQPGPSGQSGPASSPAPAQPGAPAKAPQPRLPGHIRQPEHVRQGSTTVITPSDERLTHNNHLALGIYTGGSLNGLNNVYGVQMTKAYSQGAEDSPALRPLTRSDAMTNYLEGFKEEQSHNRPIIIGLTVRFPLTARVSLSTGIVYTDLHSDFNTIMGENARVHKGQDLFYLGIPLNAHYLVWQYKSLKTYLSAGVEADWNFKSYLRQDRVNLDMERDRLQFSAALSAGVEFDIIPQIGLYAEPGVRHYFNNGSAVQNFFKDKPTDFNLQLGVRINL